MLKAALPGQMTSASAACVDAETLAAWSEGVLSGARAIEVERHLAGCVRCQAMLAAFARSLPASVEARPLSITWHMRWLVPAAAAAAIAAIWIAWPRTIVAPPTSGTTARVEAPPSAPAGRADAVKPPPLAAPETPAPAAGPRGFAAGRLGRSAPSRIEPTPAARPSPAAIDAVSASGKAAQLRTSPPPPSATPVPPPPPPLPAPQPATATSAPAPAPAPRVAIGGVAGGASAAREPVPALNESITVVDPSRVVFELIAQNQRVLADQAVPAGAGAGRGAGRGGGGGRGGIVAAAAPAINAPPARWRVLASGAIERSADAGTTWMAVARPAAPVTLTAGSAPSGLVCWLVGRGGAVLLTTDGSRFDQVIFPLPVDLSAVQASDARQAIVTTIDGRIFATTDGGTTWTLR
jgi:hypothetical protein